MTQDAFEAVARARRALRDVGKRADEIESVDDLAKLELDIIGLSKAASTIAAGIDARVVERQALTPDEMSALHGAVAVMRRMALALPPDDIDRALDLAAQAHEVSESLAVVVMTALDRARSARPEGCADWKTESER